MLLKEKPDSITYELYCSASIKEFEIILELAGKLLRKALIPYFHSSKAVDALYFKDLFRQTFLKGWLDENQCENRLQYQDLRNFTSHDYGRNLAEETLKAIPEFLGDAKALSIILQKMNNASQGKG